MPIYLQYASVKGDVTAEGHVGWIEVNSFQWGVGRGISSPTGGSSDREASAPSVSEIVVTKPTDMSTVDLLGHALEGEGEDVTLDFCKTDKGALNVYLSFTLNNTMVSGFSINTGGDRPQESISFSFTKIQLRDVSLGSKNEDGAPGTIGYDVGAGKTM
jgi:type VI secretion system secreted protein Hcp